MNRCSAALGWAIFASCWGVLSALAAEPEVLFEKNIDVRVPHISTDRSVKYDYDIVYVRARRAGDQVHKRFYTDIATPVTLEPGADLMLLHPNGEEELLVAGGEDGAITDPVMSYDAQWCYYTQIYTLKNSGPYQPPRGADVFKIHLKTRRVVRLTNQVFTPNTGAADWASDLTQSKEEKKTYLSYGVLNFGAYPLPGGRIVYTSNRNAYRPPKGYPRIALQLFVMDDRHESIADHDVGVNVEQIGYLNIAGALHPVVLADGRIIFSSLESQGIRGDILWGIWSIHPDGTNWGPVVSAFDPGGAPNAFHFQSQISDGSIIVEEYYNQNNSGFGTFIKVPPTAPEGYPAFGPAYMNDPRNKPWRFGRFYNAKPQWYRLPFMPAGSEVLTPFASGREGPADPSVVKDKESPKVGKFTHPSGAPDNHLLAIYSPGPVNHQYTFLPQLDGGIYLIKNGQPIEEPAQMRLIKNDPLYNEQWPRAVVPYQRVFGIPEPKTLSPLKNDGKLSSLLPEGTPFGLVGSSSLYKRESYPNGVVPEGQVTAVASNAKDPWRGLDAFTSHGNGMPLNWHNQGGDAGLYSNDEIHAVRILAMEPTTDRNRGPRSGRLFHSHANERLRILGEIPVRKFVGNNQPLDPDGNPDTSFLAKIPADTAFTFQTIDKQGLVLNSSQTWHQLRPGEIRTNCGGCHAHSQKPTFFELTAAAKPDYKVWDLTEFAPLVIADAASGKDSGRYDAEHATGLNFLSPAVSVEYHRHIKPILERSCAACHAHDAPAPPAGLVLDGDGEEVKVSDQGKFPGTYARLALDEAAKFGLKPVGYDSWGYPNASRYIRKLQSRRSLLVWKIFGRRLDGFTNDDHPSETSPGSGKLTHHGQEVPLEKNRSRWDIDFIGSPMPPPEAIAGTYKTPEGRTVKVPALTDEDRRVIARWIDLGCPIDLDYDPAQPEKRGYGWMCDDQRPTLALTVPHAGKNKRLDRILIGLYDYGGLDDRSLEVTADFAVNGLSPGTNLADKFQATAEGVRQLTFAQPIAELASGALTVRVKDQQGNWARIDRRFQVGQ